MGGGARWREFRSLDRIWMTFFHDNDDYDHDDHGTLSTNHHTLKIIINRITKTTAPARSKRTLTAITSETRRPLSLHLPDFDTNFIFRANDNQDACLRRFFLRGPYLPRQGTEETPLWEGQTGSKRLTKVVYCRASSTSVATPRFSVSRTASPSPSSSSARTPARSHGPLFTADNTRRVSLRSVLRRGNLISLGRCNDE